MEKTKKQNPQMNQNQSENTNLQEKQFEKEAMKVSTVSIVVNVLLSLFKLLAGVIAHSGAMISDAIHSASDVFSTIIVMVNPTRSILMVTSEWSVLRRLCLQQFLP